MLTRLVSCSAGFERVQRIHAHTRRGAGRSSGTSSGPTICFLVPNYQQTVGAVAVQMSLDAVATSLTTQSRVLAELTESTQSIESLQQEMATVTKLLQEQCLMNADAAELQLNIAAAEGVGSESSVQQRRIWQHELQSLLVVRMPQLKFALENMVRFWEQSRLQLFPELELDMHGLQAASAAALLDDCSWLM